MTPDEFKGWMKKHGLSYSKAAKALGVSVTTIRNYRSGRRPDGARVVMAKPVLKLCDALDVLAKKGVRTNG